MEINQATYKYSGFKMASDVKNQYWNLEDNAGTLWEVLGKMISSLEFYVQSNNQPSMR